MTKEQIEAFLVELSALSEKHQITIGGCGCCGSPFLSAMTEGEKGGGYLMDSRDEGEKLEWAVPE